MEIVTLINWALALLTIGFGGLGWLMPDYTMKTLDMVDTGSTMGKSEVRAASGALFVMAGVGALILSTPAAFAMIGFGSGGVRAGACDITGARRPDAAQMDFLRLRGRCGRGRARHQSVAP